MKNKTVLLILNANKGFWQQKTGQLFKNLMLSGEVEVTVPIAIGRTGDLFPESIRGM